MVVRLHVFLGDPRCFPAQGGPWPSRETPRPPRLAQPSRRCRGPACPAPTAAPTPAPAPGLRQRSSRPPWLSAHALRLSPAPGGPAQPACPVTSPLPGTVLSAPACCGLHDSRAHLGDGRARGRPPSPASLGAARPVWFCIRSPPPPAPSGASCSGACQSPCPLRGCPRPALAPPAVPLQLSLPASPPASGPCMDALLPSAAVSRGACGCDSRPPPPLPALSCSQGPAAQPHAGAGPHSAGLLPAPPEPRSLTLPDTGVRGAWGRAAISPQE